MRTRTTAVRLWPYSGAAAVVAVPMLWILLGLLVFVARTYLDLPVGTFDRPVLFVFLALGAMPLGLLLLDFIAAKGAVVGNDWIKIDFSKTVVESGNVRREASGLPDNIISPAESIQDSGGMKMVAAIRKATVTEIVCIDLKDGNAWWETRLLVLCACALGAGSALRAIVFVGKRNNKERMFLGWATPAQLLAALLDANPEYRACVTRVRMIVRQLSTFGGNPPELLPQAGAPPTPVALHGNVSMHQWSYDDDEYVMLARILLQELKSPSSVPGSPQQPVNLEEPPRRLTTGRLRELFDNCLYNDIVDRGSSNDEQLSQFLASTAPYVAIARQGVYEGLLRSELGVRAIVRDLLAISKSAG
jgi:hypothetical protein